MTGISTYAYAYNAPTTHVDLYGLAPGYLPGKMTTEAGGIQGNALAGVGNAIATGLSGGPSANAYRQKQQNDDAVSSRNVQDMQGRKHRLSSDDIAYGSGEIDQLNYYYYNNYLHFTIFNKTGSQYSNRAFISKADYPYYGSGRKNGFLSDPLFWANTGLGMASTVATIKGDFLTRNEIWYKTKTKGVAWHWQTKRWNNPGSKAWRVQQLNTVKGIRSLGSKMGLASGVLLGVDIYQKQQVNASHVLNAAMVGVSFTGVGAIVAGVYFAADVGVLMTTGRSIGDYVDDSVGSSLVEF